MKSFITCILIAVCSSLIFSPSGIIVLADSQGERDSGDELESRKLGEFTAACVASSCMSS